MTEHKYLDSQSNAKKAVLLLGAGAVILLIVGAVMNKAAHGLGGNIVMTLGVALTAGLIAFAIHYLRHREYDGVNVKRLVVIMHLAAVYAILGAVTLYTGRFTTFSYTVVTAVSDAVLAGMLTYAILTTLKVKGGIISIVIGLLLGILSLLWVNKAVAIILLILAAVLLVVTFMKIKTSKTLTWWQIVTAVVVIVFMILTLIKGSYSNYHMLMHFALIIACLLIAGAIWALVLVASKETVHPKVVDTTKQVEDYSDRSKWVVKKYQDMSYADLLNAPVDAISGVSDTDAELLNKAFQIKTVGDLANNKFFAWAKEIEEEAEKK